MDLFQNIKARRIELNMSQQELATKVGYKSRSTINKIEKGINDITQSKIVDFAKALNTTPGDLMGWDTSQAEVVNTFLSKHEKAVIDAYRQSPDLQFAIDKLLNVVSPKKIYTKDGHLFVERTDDED